MIIMIIMLLRIFLIILLVIIIVLLYKIYNANKFARRISKYSIESLYSDNLSFVDKIVNKYHTFICNMRLYMKKSDFLMKQSKKYEKYIRYKEKDYIMPIDFITNKFIIAYFFLFLAAFSQLVIYHSFNIFRYLLNFIIGYYLLDIYYYFYSKRQTKLIENDLLRAVIIMNNAFKAGKSTLQALEIASNELPYPIKDEFKKMYLDMKYGLSVDTTFNRFAKRVNLEEAVYLSSSLSILNKTGGNIVEVFSSIERTLFDKKKLDEELKNISSAPKVVVYILFMVPIVFTILIYIMNPNYFKPLTESLLGYAIIGVIVVMFAIYVFLLRRILRIEVQ